VAVSSINIWSKKNFRLQSFIRPIYEKSEAKMAAIEAHAIALKVINSFYTISPLANFIFFSDAPYR
jgi:hypothetical protein